MSCTLHKTWYFQGQHRMYFNLKSCIIDSTNKFDVIWFKWHILYQLTTTIDFQDVEGVRVVPGTRHRPL
jgi:hypothetical protein